MDRWEYQVVSIVAGADATARKLNELGQEGWELVTVWTALYYFKRPLKS
ncbi:MAG: hypothetical protein ACOX2L_01205 [Anaerolineae bacterium]|jgi:hypothetical protein|nr:DUF4177 domain-containing protein [Chloroflexota bacterium]